MPTDKKGIPAADKKGIPAAKISKGKGKYPVVNSDGQVVRVYNIRDHGKNAKALAEEFAEKNNYQLK